MASPVKTPDSDGSSQSSGSSVDFTSQLDAYMQWVNSQLKKKPGARLVEDLSNDTRDGVVFIDLINVIAGEEITGVHNVPSTYVEMRENIESILHFMSAKKIRMHHIMAKDIVDGNLKSIMRLILALAAHYKPSSVRHSSQSSKLNTDRQNLSVTGIAQGASAALTAARRNVTKVGKAVHRKGRRSHERRYFHQGSSSDLFSDSDSNFHADHPRVIPGRERDDVDGASARSSPTSGLIPKQHSRVMSSASSHGQMSTVSCVSKSKSADHISYKDSGTELEDGMLTPGQHETVTKSQYDDLMTEYLKLVDAMTIIKKDMCLLRDLLLNGQVSDWKEFSCGDVIEGTTPEERIVILNSQLQQSKENCSSLREEMSRNKLKMMEILGIKAGIQQRLDEQDISITKLKSELLHRDFQKQNFDTEQALVFKQLQDRDKLISDLKKDILRRDQKINHLQQDLQAQMLNKGTISKSMQSQMKELSDKFRMVDETGATLKAQVASQDKQMQRLAGQLLNSKSDQIRPLSTGANELGVVSEALMSLRHCFSNVDPQQLILDTIELGISSLIARLPNSHSSSSSCNLQSSYEQQASCKENLDATSDNHWSSLNTIPGGRPPSCNASSPIKNHTKVLYFIDNTTTPSLLTIYKRLGEITLHDFKGAFDHPDQYRYHFKALDPEFGTVKEEVSNEDAILPGWEGKIVAWLEKDTSAQ